MGVGRTCREVEAQEEKLTTRQALHKSPLIQLTLRKEDFPHSQENTTIPAVAWRAQDAYRRPED